MTFQQQLIQLATLVLKCFLVPASMTILFQFISYTSSHSFCLLANVFSSFQALTLSISQSSVLGLLSSLFFPLDTSEYSCLCLGLHHFTTTSIIDTSLKHASEIRLLVNSSQKSLEHLKFNVYITELMVSPSKQPFLRVLFQ